MCQSWSHVLSSVCGKSTCHYYHNYFLEFLSLALFSYQEYYELSLVCIPNNPQWAWFYHLYSLKKNIANSDFPPAQHYLK